MRALYGAEADGLYTYIPKRRHRISDRLLPESYGSGFFIEIIKINWLQGVTAPFAERSKNG